MSSRMEEVCVAGRWWVAPAILAALVVASLGIGLGGDFVWDDQPLILENRLVTEPGAWTELATSSFWDTGDKDDRFRAFFRPLVSLSYAMEYRLWGQQPFGFHLTNLLLHYCCCLLIFRLAVGEGLPPWSALGGVALFAVHPVHVESVAWISGRTDLLCGLLLLAAFVVHRSAERSPEDLLRKLAALALFGLALLAKEMAATLPLIVFIDRWLAAPGGRRIRSALRSAWPYAVVLGLYLMLRMQVLGQASEPQLQLSLGSFLATAAFVVARYLVLLVAPLGIDAHYPYKVVETLVSPIGLVSLLILSTVLVWGYRCRGNRSLLFWLSWIFVSLTPVLAFGRFGDVLMADRFLYIPSIALALLAARGMAELAPKLRSGRRLAAAGGIGVLLMLCVTSSSRARVWSDDLRLFSDMARTSAGSALVRCNLGQALYAQGEIDAAIAEFETTIEIDPNFAMAHNNLGAAFELRGDAARAIRYYGRAWTLAPGLLEAEINHAHLVAVAGEKQQGIRQLRELMHRHPDTVAVQRALADALYRSGDSNGALEQLSRSWDLDPSHAPTRYMLGKIHHEQGQAQLAARWMRAYLETDPPDDPRSRAAQSVIVASESR